MTKHKGTMAVRYGLSESATPYEVFRAILGSNKYLRLAYFLAANRSDWSDGCDLAESGLRGFDVQCAEDKEISADIYDHISNWDCDGRVFRDTAWNYNRLFDKVKAESPQLYADYLEMREADGEDWI